VIYFDDYELNYGSRFSGEARLVHEINQGAYGAFYELLLDQYLSMNSRRVFRFINFSGETGYVPIRKNMGLWSRRGDDSPLP
jgi:hypothetical protein